MSAMNIIELEKRIHQYVQTLAKFGRSFVEPQKDDSHTNLGFDFIGQKIWSRWASFDNRALILAIELKSQNFTLYGKDYKKVASFKTIGRTQSDVEKEIDQYISDTLRMGSSDFLKNLHFDITDYNFKSDTIQKWEDNIVDVWVSDRRAANEACDLLARCLNTEAEVRIWPHHFDTGIYIEPNDKIGIGFGWAIADEMIDEPYFYYSVYGLNGHNIDYDTVEPLSMGRWITGEKWNGAVLRRGNAKIGHIRRFLCEIVDWTFSN